MYALYFTIPLLESTGLLLAIIRGYRYRFSINGIFYSLVKVSLRRFLSALESIKAYTSMSSIFASTSILGYLRLFRE